MKNKLFKFFLIGMTAALVSVSAYADEITYTTSKVKDGAIDWNNFEAPKGLSEGMDVSGMIDLVALPEVEIKASSWNASVNALPVSVTFLGSGDFWLYGSATAPVYIEVDFNRPVNINYIQNYARGHAVMTGGWGAKSDYTGYQYSNDGETWTEFARGSADEDGNWFNVILDQPVTARYLRVAGIRGNNNIGVAKLRVWGTPAEDTGYSWVDVERKWGSWGVGTVSSNMDKGGDGANCDAITSACDPYSTSYAYSKAGAAASGNTYMQFQLPRVAKLSRARVVVNQKYPQSAQNFSIYGSVSANSGEFIKLAEVGSTPLTFGEFNYIDLDCPTDIRYVTIIKNNDDVSEGALSFIDVKFEEDFGQSGEFAIYNKISDGKKYSLGDTKINTYVYRNTDVVEEEGTYIATFAYYSDGEGDHNVYPIVGIFDEDDKLVSYTQLKTPSGSNMVNGMPGNALRTFYGNIDIAEGTSAVKCFATAKRSSAGDTPVQGAPFAGAGKVTVEIAELFD